MLALHFIRPVFFIISSTALHNRFSTRDFREQSEWHVTRWSYVVFLQGNVISTSSSTMINSPAGEHLHEQPVILQALRLRCSDTAREVESRSQVRRLIRSVNVTNVLVSFPITRYSNNPYVNSSYNCFCILAPVCLFIIAPSYRVIWI